MRWAGEGGDCHLATLEGMGEWTSGVEWVDSSNEGERIGSEDGSCPLSSFATHARQQLHNECMITVLRQDKMDLGFSHSVSWFLSELCEFSPNFRLETVWFAPVCVFFYLSFFARILTVRVPRPRPGRWSSFAPAEKRKKATTRLELSYLVRKHNLTPSHL